MNIILFSKHELNKPLSLKDTRAIHILSVLKCQKGSSFDAGIINGPKGKAKIREIKEDRLYLDFQFEREIACLYPITLIVGLSRPQTVRKILRESTSLGLGRIYFVQTEKGEKSYAKSRLWTKGEYKNVLKSGAEQAFCTKLPEVKLFSSLTKCLDLIQVKDSDRIALDNYEAKMALSEYSLKTNKCIIFAGPERGWSSSERNHLRENGFTLVHLGKRVLRTETACLISSALILARWGFI
jgi:16S rRNA (uracil1498-N3)-methyltransferase